MKKIVVIGMGLIGGSIGKAVIKRSPVREVIGVCRSQSSLERAVKEKALTKGYVNDYEKAFRGAELIVIAVPFHKIQNILEEISGIITDKTTVVTDVGSAKKTIVKYAARFKNQFSFVGAHPLAGSEKTGVENSDADLFQGASCVLTRASATVEKDLKEVRVFWESIGAKVSIETPDKHDEIVAFTSHLPHAVAYALTGTGVKKKEWVKYISSGFRDTTRVASSDPALWSNIFLNNKGHLLKAVNEFKKILSGIEKDILSEKKDALENRFKTYKEKRDDIFQKR
ncbi:MAG: prephenate dehydrogenase [Candidatus Omnitrophota bacterium]